MGGSRRLFAQSHRLEELSYHIIVAGHPAGRVAHPARLLWRASFRLHLRLGGHCLCLFVPWATLPYGISSVLSTITTFTRRGAMTFIAPSSSATSLRTRYRKSHCQTLTSVLRDFGRGFSKLWPFVSYGTFACNIVNKSLIMILCGGKILSLPH